MQVWHRHLMTHLMTQVQALHYLLVSLHVHEGKLDYQELNCHLQRHHHNDDYFFASWHL